jgi:hypothetical protein
MIPGRIHSSILSGIFIYLKYTECVALRIDEISLPAFAGNGELWQSDLTSVLQNRLRGRIKIFDLHGTDVRIRAALRWWQWSRTFKDRTSNTVCFYSPVLDGQSGFSGDIPAEDCRIKIHCLLWFIRLDFKI